MYIVLYSAIKGVGTRGRGVGFVQLYIIYHMHAWQRLLNLNRILVGINLKHRVIIEIATKLVVNAQNWDINNISSPHT